MKKYIFLIFIIFLTCFLYANTGTNVFLDGNGNTQIMVGNIVNTVNGTTGDVEISTSTITGFVLKTGDTMTGDLNAPNFNATYGVSATTGVFTGLVETSSLTATNQIQAGTITDGTITINSGKLLSGATVQSDIGDFNTIYVSSIYAHSPVYFQNDIDMVSNNIITNGLVDGRDISTDGTTLDNVVISTGALELSKVNRSGDTMTGTLNGTDISLTYGISAATGTFSGAIICTSLDTGQGANQLYDMNQNVRTTDSPTFAGETLTYGIMASTGVFNGNCKIYKNNGGLLIESDNATNAYLDLMETSIPGMADSSFGIKGNGIRFEHNGNDNKLYIKTGTAAIVATVMAIDRVLGNFGIGTTSPTSKLTIDGVISEKAQTFTSTSTITTPIKYINCNTTSTAFTLTLDSDLLTYASTSFNYYIIIQDISGIANTNNIVIETEGSEKINGSDSAIINSNYGYLKLKTNGSNWFIIGS